MNETKMLQAEWRELKSRLDAILEKSEGRSIYDEEAQELIYAARQIRYRIRQLSAVVAYAENDAEVAAVREP